MSKGIAVGLLLGIALACGLGGAWMNYEKTHQPPKEMVTVSSRTISYAVETVDERQCEISQTFPINSTINVDAEKKLIRQKFADSFPSSYIVLGMDDFVLFMKSNYINPRITCEAVSSVGDPQVTMDYSK